MKKILTLALSAVLLTATAFGYAAPAYAASYLTVKGEVVLFFGGGGGSVEDVKLTVQYNNVPAEYKDYYMGTVRWYGNPGSNGNFSIPTEAYSGAMHLLKVTAELEGYSSDYDVLTMGQDTTQRLVLKAGNTAEALPIGGTIVMPDGSLLPNDICPEVSITVSNTVGTSKVQACGGLWTCNAVTGQDVTVTPRLEGYVFEPESLTVEKIKSAKNDFNFTMRAASGSDTAAEETVPETTAPEEGSSDTVKLYFMTGSSIGDPGQVFAEFDVPKNARGNTVNIAKTITKDNVPQKDGYTFSHWQERSLKDPSKMGNRISGAIWTNETDQYIYAQYKENESDQGTVKLYFMTGSSISDPGEVFAEFDVPKNARGNTVNLAKTIKKDVPEREGAVFSHWQERSLKDPSKMGNRINGVIWTNEQDQYIYAQYK